MFHKTLSIFLSLSSEGFFRSASFQARTIIYYSNPNVNIFYNFFRLIFHSFYSFCLFSFCANLFIPVYFCLFRIFVIKYFFPSFLPSQTYFFLSRPSLHKISEETLCLLWQNEVFFFNFFKDSRSGTGRFLRHPPP